MRCAALPFLLLPLLLASLTAPAQAKPKQCFTPAEQTAEQIVRYGLRLREGAQICSQPPYTFKLVPLWSAVDQQFGPRFANQSQVRERAFRREFGNDAINRIEMWNGRVVLDERNHPASPEFCKELEKSLKDAQAKGWGTIARAAAKAKDVVKMDFRVCR